MLGSSSGILKISSWGLYAKAPKIPSCVDQPLNLEKRCLPSWIFKVSGYASAWPECTVIDRWDSVHVKNAGCGCGPACVFIYIHTYLSCFFSPHSYVDSKDKERRVNS